MIVIDVSSTDTNRAIDAVWRIESPRLIAGLARIVRDVGLAEDLAHDALVAALEQWPESGIPRNPGAWLMATAKHRAIDLLRRRTLLDRKHQELGYELEIAQDASTPDLDAALDDDIGDDLLRLVFTACHPVLSAEARVALTLRLLGGLTTDEIARAFLVSEPTVAQRIVRAKKTLAKERVPFEVPGGDELAGQTVVRARSDLPDLQRGLLGDIGRRLDAASALRGRVAAGAHSRGPDAGRTRSARSRRVDGDSGVARECACRRRTAPRSCCSIRIARSGIRCSFVAASPQSSGPKHCGRPHGPYLLQASIAACHARARQPEDTDWMAIAALYAELVDRDAFAGRPAQSCGRALDGVRSAGWPGSRGHARRRARARELPPAPKRARRPAR